MNKRTAFFTNDFFLLDEDGKIVGIECNGHRAMLGDRVRIKGDTHGFIASGITKEGYGKIVDFTDNYSDHYFGIQMENGEYAHVKRARIAEILPSTAVSR